MLHAYRRRDTEFLNGSAVLMARIVNRDGVCIEPGNVRAIEYSVYELDPCWPHHLNVVSSRSSVPLDVDDVLFDALDVGDLWTVDAAGYNFRHEIDFGPTARSPRSAYRYEVHYQMTLAGGQKTCVRFQIRVQS
jgi:hypothetical protein